MSELYKYLKSIWKKLDTSSVASFIEDIQKIDHMDVIYIQSNPEYGQSAALILVSTKYPKQYLEVGIYRGSSYGGDIDWIDNDIKRAVMPVTPTDKVMTFYV